MMYYLKPEYSHFTEEHSHDLWIMIRTLQETPTQKPGNYNPQKETGDQMLKKYYQDPEKKSEPTN